ncbi:hypothetical protein ACS0TY_033994 [Phlomoides rotata]
MDQKPLPSSATKAPTRKMRFAPKAPPRREPKLVLPKVEKNENDLDDAKAEDLLRRLNETTLGRPKVEKKATRVQVAFGSGGSSSSIRSYAAHKVKNQVSDGSADPSVEKEYKEPWDYYTNYPVTLPIRRPYAGNPELLDSEEFGEGLERSAYDENEANSAEELGLLDEDTGNNMFFLQLPSALPGITQSANAEVPERQNNDNRSNGSGKSQKPCPLESLPAGLIGKMIVYRSGAVKLKLGDIIYDVSAGLNCLFAQDAVAINTEGKQCCNLGELNKRAVVTPDIDSMLDAIDDSI